MDENLSKYSGLGYIIRVLNGTNKMKAD